jgi:putative heme degradation protein
MMADLAAARTAVADAREQRKRLQTRYDDVLLAVEKAFAAEKAALEAWESVITECEQGAIPQ